MNYVTRDGSDTAATPPGRLAPSGDQSQPPLDSLVGGLENAIDRLLQQRECRKKLAERLRGLQKQLLEINTAMEAKLELNRKALVPFQAAVDIAYSAWNSAREALEAEQLRGEHSMAGLRGHAADVIKEINAPDPRFANMVKNWSRPADYVEEPALPPMPEVNGPRR